MATTLTSDPRGAYRRLREEWGEVAPVELEPGVNAWLLMGWEEICHVVRREPLFSRNPRNWRLWQEKVVAPDSPLGPIMFPRDSAYYNDGVEHYRLRTPIDDGLARIDQRRMRRSVNKMCADLIASFAARGEADLISEYAALIPMLAVTDLFGLDIAEGRKLQRALVAVFGVGEDAQDGNRAFEEIMGRAMQSHMADPQDDLTTVFLNHPNLRDAGEVAQSMVLMITAGYETTLTWIAHSLRMMLSDPRFAGQLGGWRPGVDDALDEVLWREPPMANMPARYALRDTEVGGQPIQRGDAIILGFAAANGDPRIHTSDIYMELGNQSHLAWSAGPHTCPAQIPARIITRGAVDTVLSLLPGLQMAWSDEDLSPRPSPWTRCPSALPVTFPPRHDMTPPPGQ
ncbi:MAG: cytochrome P450 [Nocardiopsaceae bacterium]|nr:cytochrome P450 [Nocardiopsaceae bacterium]